MRLMLSLMKLGAKKASTNSAMIIFLCKTRTLSFQKEEPWKLIVPQISAQSKQKGDILWKGIRKIILLHYFSIEKFGIFYYLLLYYH